MSAKGLAEWVRTADATELAHRVETEPDFLDSRESDRDGFGVLHHAAAQGRVGLIQALIARHVSVDLPSGLREEPEDVDERYDPGYTPLMCAAAHGQLKAVTYLISAGADPSRRDYCDGTALHSAAANGSVPILNALLGVGCDPEVSCRYKANSEELGFYWIGTPLHVASLHDHAGVARALLGHGAEVDPLRTIDERRPLHYAAAMGATRTAEVLLRAGADPTRAEVFHGYTPLHYAADGGHVECVRLLLRYGADPRARLRETGHTPLDLISENSERAEATRAALRTAVAASAPRG